MDTPLPEETWNEIKAALRENRKIEAIKLYRAATGAGLAESKAAVDKLEAELRAAEPATPDASKPEKSGAPVESTGCLGSVFLLAALLGICGVWFGSW